MDRLKQVKILFQQTLIGVCSVAATRVGFVSKLLATSLLNQYSYKMYAIDLTRSV
jgi:hypothetical protein